MRFQPTVDVEPIAGHSALKMTWQHEVRDKDVEIAFKDIMRTLTASERPVYVVVDLLSNPNFPSWSPCAKRSRLTATLASRHG